MIQIKQAKNLQLKKEKVCKCDDCECVCPLHFAEAEDFKKNKKIYCKQNKGDNLGLIFSIFNTISIHPIQRS